ncbi:MAG TPA: hypothetical protein VN213_10825 [Solirubrobacteraceae bacterium]|nr:hypothetical protein [Solirubrobacteraceae bacterium]
MGVLGDRVGGVLLVRADDPGRTALDPAGDVLAALRVTVLVDHAAALVADQAASLTVQRFVSRPPVARQDHARALLATVIGSSV